jgi:hypothetical protein
MKLFILPVVLAGLFLGSCSETPPVSIKKGTEVTFDEQKMTVDFKASSVLVSEKEQQTLVAPEGKIYVVVDVKAENGDYFLSVKEGDKEVEEVDFLVAGPFVRDLDLTTSPDKSNLYLLDVNGKYTIEVKSYADAIATLDMGTLKDEATVKVSDRMKAFLNEFTEGGHILEIAKKYVKEGVNPYDIATESNGEPMFLDPITQLEISNIKADGTYVCSADMWYDAVEITWDGDNISKIVVTVK